MTGNRTSIMEKKGRESIHSGHFMISEFEAEAQDDEEDVAVPVPDDQVSHTPVAAGQRALLNKMEEYLHREQAIPIDVTLTKLFQCMTIAYRQKLTSPKWNRFRGLKLRWKDKIRLNNLIWRAWHMQFIKKKSARMCQFASPLDVDTHSKPEAIIMEGKYWKRRTQAVSAEYKKWRLFFKNKKNKDSTEMSDIDMDTSPSPLGSFLDSMVTGFDEDFIMDFTDTLFSSVSPQPFQFPNPRELNRGPGLPADIMQPGLVPLQPNLDDFMDTFEPLQEMWMNSVKLAPVLEDPPQINPEMLLEEFLTSQPPSQISEKLALGPPFVQSVRTTSQPPVHEKLSSAASSVRTTPQPLVHERLASGAPSVRTTPQPLVHERLASGAPSARTTPQHRVHNQPISRISAPVQPRKPGRTVVKSESDTRKTLRKRPEQSPRSAMVVRTPVHQVQSEPKLGSSPAVSILHQVHSEPIFTPPDSKQSSSYDNTVRRHSSFTPGDNKPVRHDSTESLPTVIQSTAAQAQVFAVPSTTEVLRFRSRSRSASSIVPHILPDKPPSYVEPPLTSILPAPFTVKQEDDVKPTTNLVQPVLFSVGAPPPKPPPLTRDISPKSGTRLKMNTPYSLLTLPPPSSTVTSLHSPPTSPSLNPPPPSSASPTNLPSPGSPSLGKVKQPEQTPYKVQERRRVCHINAEQKRRCNIKNGFDVMHSLIPSLHNNPSAKVSKATLLLRGTDYIKQLKTERAQLQEEAEAMRAKIEQLNKDISAYQAQLPATGAPINRAIGHQMEDLFNTYQKERTLEDYKWWVFSTLLYPMLDSFNRQVSTQSLDDLYRTTFSWLDQSCGLMQLRPVVLGELRKLSTTTSVLSDPSRLPDEAVNAVMLPTKTGLH